MQVDHLYMRIATIGYIILWPFVLSVLVLGYFITSRSAKYEIPKYWARPCILTSIICSDLIYLCSYFGDYSCLISRLGVTSTVSYWTSMTLLGFHVLISMCNPYILSGKKQLAAWIFLIILSWITGLSLAFVTIKEYAPSNFGHAQPNDMTTSGFIENETTSSHGKYGQTASPLDALDIDFNTNLLTTEPRYIKLTTRRYFYNATDEITYESTHESIFESYGQESCYDDENLYQITVLFYLILYVGFLLCAVLILASVKKTIHRAITGLFKSCHLPLSPSQEFVQQWIKQQRISSALFIELHSVYVALFLACQVGYRGYCTYMYEYVSIVYPTLFALSCFMLKDVRNVFLNLCTACCRIFRQDPGEHNTPTHHFGLKSVDNSSTPHPLDASQI